MFASLPDLPPQKEEKKKKLRNWCKLNLQLLKRFHWGMASPLHYSPVCFRYFCWHITRTLSLFVSLLVCQRPGTRALHGAASSQSEPNLFPRSAHEPESFAISARAIIILTVPGLRNRRDVKQSHLPLRATQQKQASCWFSFPEVSGLRGQEGPSKQWKQQRLGW